MKNFTFEDGVFYCNKEPKGGYGYHEVEMKIKGNVELNYEIEEQRLRKPKACIEKVKNVILQCKDCDNHEDVTEYIAVDIKNNSIQWNFK